MGRALIVSILPMLFWLVGVSRAEAQEVTLPLERYHALHRAAHPKPPESAVPLALEEVAVTLRLPAEGPARILQEWTFTVAGGDWQRVPLPVVGTFLSADLGDVDGVLEPTGSGSGSASGADGWTLTVRGAGRHRVRLESAVTVAEDEGSTRRRRSLKVPLPVAAVVHGWIETPTGTVDEVVAEAGAVVASEGPGQWRFAGEPGAVAALVFLERSAVQDRGELPLAFEAASSTALTLGRTRVQGRGWLRLRVLQGRMETVRVAVPPGLEVTGVTGEEMAEWRLEGDRVVVDLQRPARGEVLLAFTLSGPAPTAAMAETAGAEVTSPVLVAAGAVRERLATRVQVEGDGLLTLADAGSGRRPTAEEQGRFPGPDLATAGGSVALIVPDATRPPRWNVAWAEATEVLAVQVDSALVEVLLSEAGRAYYRVGAVVRSRGVAELALTLPPGFALTEARREGEEVLPGSRGEALVLPLAASAARQLLVVEGFLPLALPTGGGRLTVPIPQASAPMAQVSVRVLLPGEWRGKVAETGRMGGARVPGDYELLEPPPGFAPVEATWSALSPHPAPLGIEIDHDAEREEWF
jgi:hypothetical protein